MMTNARTDERYAVVATTLATGGTRWAVVDHGQDGSPPVGWGRTPALAYAVADVLNANEHGHTLTLDVAARNRAHLDDALAVVDLTDERPVPYAITRDGLDALERIAGRS